MILRASGARAAPSDPAAWLAEHGDVLWRYALGRLRDPVLAEDAVQEALAAALASREGFRSDSTERTWLVGILRIKIADLRRRSARTREVASGSPPASVLDDMYDRAGAWKSAPGRVPARDDRPEFMADLERCLGELPGHLADAFVLREVRGMQPASVCEQLSITRENLWVRMHRARLLLRRCLAGRWGDSPGPGC